MSSPVFTIQLKATFVQSLPSITSSPSYLQKRIKEENVLSTYTEKNPKVTKVSKTSKKNKDLTA